ncbi:MAG: short chain dehydrogenase family protein [Frankiales bacterium]|nr:short chain dehydrogenase family protein [Frankiales bacterium]
MSRLAGKVAVVTGGAKGIGRGIARGFVKEGAAVLVADIDEQAGATTEAELRALGGTASFVRTDVTSKADVVGLVHRAVEEHGRLDVLVNNAIKLSPNVVLEEKTDEMLDSLVRTGLTATWWAMQAAFPTMRDQAYGRILNMYSIDAENGAWFRSDYIASKSAILGLTRAAAMEWARYGITCNALAPAAAGSVFEEYAAKDPGFVEMSAKIKPMGRVGYPEEDVAPVCCFLASEDAGYVTGEVLHVDGGLHLPRYNNKPAGLTTSSGQGLP